MTYLASGVLSALVVTVPVVLSLAVDGARRPVEKLVAVDIDEHLQTERHDN